MKISWKAAGTSAALSGLFLVVYTWCNWLTSLRGYVGSYYFSWERHIPFVPVMILPYMSIDLFFITAPFLARSDRERRTLAWRIAAAILIAAACFLLWPLTFAFGRPHVDGVLGAIYDNFRIFDLPFNEFPSLHIALLMILGDMFCRHTKGILRGVLIIWFILLGVSPLLTYQHHMIDILGGFVLAAICFHLFRDEPLRQPFVRSPRMAIYYGAGAAILAGLAFARLPMTVLLLWPAFSLALIAVGYLFFGPGIFRKDRGRHAWTTWVLLWPVLIGQKLSLIYYARQCGAYDKLTDHLWIGRHLSNQEAQQARHAGVIAVIDLAGEFAEPRSFRDLPYLQLSIIDLTPPTAGQIEQAVAFIQEHAGSGIVYLHCKIGYSRTAAIAGAYLMAIGEAENAEEALAKMRQARPSIIVRPEAMGALQGFKMTSMRVS